MKKYVFVVLSMLMLSGLSAQNTGGKIDTLSTGTYYYYPNDAATAALAKAFPKGNLYITMRSDSLSGATLVVNEIQYACANATATPLDWVTQATGSLTSNGAASQTLIFEDILFGADKWRIKSVVTGVQTTKLTKGWRFKSE